MVIVCSVFLDSLKPSNNTIELCDAPHLDKAERVVFLHEAFNAAANLLKTSLVLADLGNVLLYHRPIDVPMSVNAFLQSGYEVEYLGLHLVTQLSQALLTVIHALLDD